jgi:uncharacterized protein (DUF1800 family)
MVRAEIAVLRFGLGARPGELSDAGPDPRDWLLSQIQTAVPLAGSTPLSSSDRILDDLSDAREQRAAMRRERAAPSGTEPAAPADPVRNIYLAHYGAQVLARAQSAALTARPFAERLVHFWSNHFAVSADKGAVSGIAGTLENEAIRPHVAGRFIDLLTAVEQHPAMIAFLDNQYSVGAESPLAQNAARRTARDASKREFGINENLAREILELHTLGVNGGYTQRDVTAFAQVITGWSIGGGKGRLAGGSPGRFCFRENLHEPGAKSVFGKVYRENGVRQGEAVLADLALQPATAHFIATKLVRHFVADDPPAAAVGRVAHAFLKTGGDLPQVYTALVHSPEAWSPDMRKFKTPQDFVFSSLRALNVSPQRPEEVVRSFDLLGQRQFTPGSPAGWPDIGKAWDGSDALMHRVLWASRLADRYEKGFDPIEVAAASLGSYARPETVTALQRATSGPQALALLLMSPEFQRR